MDPNRRDTHKPESVSAAAVATPPAPAAMSGMTASSPVMTRPMTSMPKERSGAMFKIRCMNQDGQVVTESSQILTAMGKPMTTFHVSKMDNWAPGHYRLEVIVNDAPAATVEFEVR